MSVPLGTTPGAVPDGEEDDGDGKKKAKNTYKQLIKGIPGACVGRYGASGLTVCDRETFHEEGRLPDHDDAGASEAEDLHRAV